MNGSTMRSRKKSKDILKQRKLGHNNPKSEGHRKSKSKREIDSITALFKTHAHHTRKSSNK